MSVVCVTISGNSNLSYTKEGTGERALLLFHGFGQDHTAFSRYAEILGHSFTLYSFDLYFHGSEWHNGEDPLSKAHWKQILLKFLQENKIERFSLLGFSMGAKFALASLETVPDKVDQLILLAPDGIKTNFWYSLATSTPPLRAIFKGMVQKPGRFQSLTKILRATRLIDLGVLRFAESQMDTEEKRRRVYLSWVVFRNLKFNTRSLVDLMNAHPIKVTAIIGKSDTLITANHLSKFLGQLEQARLELVNARHAGVIGEAANMVKQILHMNS